MSSKSQVRKSMKSNHKHDYEEVLLRMTDLRESYHLGKRCRICGKTKLVQLFISEKDEWLNVYTLLTNEEILEKFKDHPIHDYDWGVSYT